MKKNKTHYGYSTPPAFGQENYEDDSTTLCGTEGPNLFVTKNWEEIDCNKCLNLKDKFLERLFGTNVEKEI
jgi:hypothetical protein